jgi:hypothetical protein
MGTITELRPDRAATAATRVCRYCRYHPAARSIFGYCSWDCHDADGQDDPDDAA